MLPHRRLPFALLRGLSAAVFFAGSLTVGQAASSPPASSSSNANPASATPPAHAGDPAFAALQARSREAANARVTRPNGVVAASRTEAARIRAERDARTKKFRAAAQAAREFHAAYPSHPKAAEARKVEALAGLEGIAPKDKAYERAALAVATAFRHDRSHSLRDRIEVAHAIESREIQLRTLGRTWFSQPVLAEIMLDRLRTEFGEQPEIWGRYLSLAENASCDAGREVAYRVVQSSYAPEPTRDAARLILDRYTLIGQPLDFPLTPTQGRPTTLAQVAGRTTVVCFWDGKSQPAGPPGLADLAKNPLPNTRWVYVSIGDLGPLPKGAKPRSAPPGTTCVETLGWQSPLIARLRLSQLPWALVLDEQTRLSGYGRIDEIPALLAGIGRKRLP